MKEQFMNTVSDGKWFEVKGRYNGRYAVKMKASDNSKGQIDALWLSFSDQEAMSIEEYSEKNWTFDGEIFVIQGAGVYHFGSFAADEESIYDDGLNIMEDRMYEVIMNNVSDGFIDESELKDVWGKLVNNQSLGFDFLDVQN